MHRQHATFDREKAAKFNEWAAETLPIILPNLGLHAGDTVADIGAGGGAFAVAFAEIVGPSGRVIAVDSYPEMLQFVEEYAAKHTGDRTGTVGTLLLPESGDGLPRGEFDLVFMRQVYHHLADPPSYLAKVRDALRPGGRIVIIDFIPGSSHGPRGHAVSEDDIRQTASSVGLQRLARYDTLTEFGRSFTIYGVHPDE